ncbi:hypothetical protein NDN01_14675 [Sphingomonas sp. QA11]|uniref:hypothetical protein n=1 Tax=Sphingomonas sp. QA11 TaxID=2950605 RepID=UPI002348F352|nr:hypothetical protein [Sphingomonas sp. QA11]WCM25309.1 hypothetical protein NDN01_14675 [Sphingomonas sp. QA11]
MIDNLALAISHGLMLLAAWVLLRRPDLDKEPDPEDSTPAPKGVTSKSGNRPGA